MHLLRPLARATALVAAATVLSACPPDSGGPTSTTTSPGSTTSTTWLLPRPVSGYESPLGTGATLPGGGAILMAHVPAAGSDRGLPGPWPLWQYSASTVRTLSVAHGTSGLPGFPTNPRFPTVAPGWERSFDATTGQVRTASPFAPFEPVVLGTVSPAPTAAGSDDVAWSPDGRYVAVIDHSGGPTADASIYDTTSFTRVRVLPHTIGAPVAADPTARPVWTRDSSAVLVGTSSGVAVVTVADAGADTTAPWPAAKPCRAVDVSVSGRVAVACANPVGSEFLFELFTQELDGSGSRLVTSPTLLRPLGGIGIAPDAVFSPDGSHLAVGLNTTPALTGTRGGLAVVTDEPGASPTLLTLPTVGVPAGEAGGGDVPIGWRSTLLQE